MLNGENRGKASNPIIIDSSDDETGTEHSNDESETESSDDDSQEDDFNNFFDPTGVPMNFYNEDNLIQLNPMPKFNPPPININHPAIEPPLPPPPLFQNPNPIFPHREEQNQRAGFRNGILDFFGNAPKNFFVRPQPPVQRDPIEPLGGFFNIGLNRPNNPPGGFFGFNFNPQPQPPQPDNTKKKQIKLNGIDINMIDVPHNVLTVLKKGCDVSPNFIMGRASSYIQMVLQHGEIPEDLLDRLVIAACDPKTTPSSTFINDNISVLRNFFPEYKVADLKKEFQTNKHLLLNTIESLKKNSTYKKMSKPRLPNTEITITDPIASVQLDELYDEYEKERKKKEKEEEEQRQIEQATKDGSLIECECCICEVPFDWMIQCPEGHLMCKKCVERQIETAISEGRSNVPCLKFGGCDQNISMAELQRLIPKKTLERLVATETLNAITAAELEHTVTCHKCGYIVIYDGNGPMNCPQCKAQTCPKCGGAWHPNMTCEQFKEIDKDRIVEEQMNEAVVRTCPKCKTQFMKDEGCNKMECPRCHTWICYWCRKIIPKEVGYEHFWRQQGPCPPDKCPLWVQNDTLHLIEAEKAKDQAKGDLRDNNPKNNEEEEKNEEKKV